MKNEDVVETRNTFSQLSKKKMKKVQEELEDDDDEEEEKESPTAKRESEEKDPEVTRDKLIGNFKEYRSTEDFNTDIFKSELKKPFWSAG